LSDGCIFGIHAVLEALQTPRRRVTRVVVAAGRRDQKIATIVAAARRAGIVVQRSPRASLDRHSGGGAHQGVVAWVASSVYETAESVVSSASTPALFVVLDGVEDPRNLGAVIRAAAAAWADGLFIPERGATGITAATVKTAAGAVDRVPIARIGNVVSFIKSLKQRGIWVVGLDPEGGQPWTEFDLSLPVAIVLGGEGRGLRRLARETCDAILTIPLSPRVESLNLAVAAGVVLFEAVRQRTPSGGRRNRLDGGSSGVGREGGA
jgi:23S rRNA (guanosine2251-2'-O)-methyltransferase